MYILNFFFIVIILVSLIFKIEFVYLISLLSSLAAATFIYVHETLANILLTIAIFNLTPLVCRQFNFILRKQRSSWEEKRTLLKASFEQMLKERSLISQSNLQLNKEASKIAELYRITKDMSAVLGFNEIFDILGKKLIDNFQFTKIRLILIDEEKDPLKIQKVWEIKYTQPHSRQVNIETQDVEMLKHVLRSQRLIYLKEKPIVSVSLMTDNKFLGALVVEDLAAEALENFSILANQFSLEFKRVRLYQKIQELAITDGLTGLFVRRYLLERLEEEMKRSARRNLALAFMMIDIDHFKQCNDRFGHLTGDAVLQEVAKMIKTNVREIDFVARYGGEEFAVVLPDTDKEGAVQAAERIHLGIAEHKFKAYDETMNVQVSIGVALYPQDANLLPQLIDKADQALYRAKQQGRNRVCFFSASPFKT